jgi:K+-sensing histidine kinase KdpD
LLASGAVVYFSSRYFTQFKLYLLTTERFNTILLKKNQLSAEHSKLTASEMQLSKINATKDQLFLIIGKDLKTPLLHIINLLQVLSNQATSFSQEELKKFANQMNVSVKDLLSLLDNLLQWSRLQSGKAECLPETIKLNEFIRKNSSKLNWQVESKSICMNIQVPDTMEINADVTIFQTVFFNLLSQAVTFTKENGTISITGFHQHNAAGLIITYDEESINTFHLSSESGLNQSINDNEQENQTKLNLFLCKEFIEHNNGKLFIHSKAAVGTVITLSLPQ